MKVVLAGGSGQVGTLLARAFQKDGHEVVVLSRAGSQRRPWRVVSWDGAALGDWCGELEGAEVVVNLAGRSVNCRYTASNRSAIKNSRINSVHAIGQAIQRANNPPRVWLQAATATIYAHRFDAANDELTGILGGSEPGAPDTWRFSIEVARSWELAVEQWELPATRKVLMRSAMTMSPDPGGVFDILLRLVRWGLGGRAGDGRQYVSWIHENDFVRAVYHLVADESLEGPVNLASPQPLTNDDFMRILRGAWGIRWGVPAPRLLLEIGAFFLRTETELVLKSRRVVPKRLLDSGFQFEFPSWSEAAVDLCRRWQNGHRRKSPSRVRTAWFQS